MLPTNYVTAWIRWGVASKPLNYREIACKLWWEVTTGDFATWTNPNRASFCQLLAQHLGLILRNVLPVGLGVDKVNCDLFYSTGGFNILEVPSIGGLILGGFYTPALSCCVIKRTAKVGRSGVGRLFIPGIPKIWLTGDSINGTAMTAYQLACDQLLANFVVTLPPNPTVTLEARLHSLQDNDLTKYTQWNPRPIPTYLYRRRYRT